MNNYTEKELVNLSDEKDKIQSKRLKYCKAELAKLGFAIMFEDSTTLEFMFKGAKVKYFPFTGWASGKSIKDGRGFKNLINQLK